MNNLAHIRTSAIFAFGSVAILILAVTGKISILGNDITVAEQRPILYTIAGALFCAAIALEYRTRVRKPKRTQGDLESGLGHLTPEQFFQSIGSPSANNLADMFQGSRRITIVARSAINIFNLYYHAIQKIIEQGGQVDLIVVSSELSEGQIYGKGPEQLQINIESTMRHVLRLQKIRKDGIGMSESRHVPTFTAIKFEYSDTPDTIFIVFNFTYGAMGLDRPAFVVCMGDKWYDIFNKEILGISQSSLPIQKESSE